MQSHFQLLGYKVRDVVTGYEGVAESICFDLYGCIQLIIRPEVTKDKPTEVPDGRWFDAKRLVVISDKPVMPAPDFAAEIGPAEKPIP